MYLASTYLIEESSSDVKSIPAAISESQHDFIDSSVDKAPQASEQIPEIGNSKRAWKSSSQRYPEGRVRTKNSNRKFMPETGKVISSIEFPAFERLDAVDDSILDRLKFFRDKAREHKRIGQDLFLAGAAHNAYLADQFTLPAEQRDLAAEKEVYDSLLFYTLLACWADSYCDEFILMLYVPATHVSNIEMLAWTMMITQRKIGNREMLRAITRIRSKMTQQEIDIAEYKVSNFLYYKSQEKFDFLSFILDYYDYDKTSSIQGLG